MIEKFLRQRAAAQASVAGRREMIQALKEFRASLPIKRRT